ncbi:hypothetical protein N8072_01030 [bacterium]|nr:hypothetical protein [bacterium]MDB4128614.1 hypothetical protein [bacterium]MDC1257244.1 hypothetical protein [bacterium]
MTNRTVLDDFFKLSKEKPWGQLVSVKCKVSDISKWRDQEPIITDKMREVVSTPGWQDLQSEDFSLGNSGRSPFFMFKVNKVYESISKVGVKTPVHLHHVAKRDELSVHPSNNKIEVLAEFFPEMEITCLYHDYDFLSKYYPDELTGWYKQFDWTPITSADQYLELFGLDHEETEIEIGFDHVSNIINNNDKVWGKVKPRKRDWNRIDISKHADDELLENSLFLTVSDRFHRFKMAVENVAMGDILKETSPGNYKYCGRVYNDS